MNLPPWSGRILHGLCAGILLAVLRAPLGLDWTQVAVVQGTSAALFRAAGLLVVALALDGRRAAFRGGLGADWACAVAAGFGTQLFLLDRTPESRAGHALLCVLAVLFLRALSGARGEPSGVEQEGEEKLARRERPGLVALGAGVALALEGLAHEARLFTGGTGDDEGLLALVFLVLVALGGVAFGPLCRRLKSPAPRFALGLALAAATGLIGLQFLAALTPEGLFTYLRRMEPLLDLGRRLDGVLGIDLGLADAPSLDGASIGTLWTTALLGAAALALPAFGLGAALASTRDVARVTHALAGAALGLFVRPHLVRLLADPLTAGEYPTVTWQLLAGGTLLAAAALAGLAWGAPRSVAGLALAALAAALPWSRPGLFLPTLSPWSVRPIEPELLLPSAEGLLALEPLRGGILGLTLDRRRLTPTLDEEAGDELGLRCAFELLAPEVRARTVRALVVGQLTPARARVLRSLGTLELERTAPWHAAMAQLETRLFAGEEAPPGTIVPPGAARARLADGAYDWVVAFGARGPIISWKSEARELWGGVDAPRMTALDLPEGTLGVAWIAADARVARGVELAPLLLTFDQLERPSFGLVRGTAAPGPLPLFELGAWPGPSVRANLMRMPQLRAFELERAWAAGLSSAMHPGLARGLALHYAAQTLSSPYESRAQQIELDEEALRGFFEAVPPPGGLDRLSAALWESLSWLFLEKRQPEHALVFLEPVAERFAPWPQLDRTLARAYRELLEPAEALRFADRALALAPGDIDLLVEAGRAAIELGDPRRGVDYLERALALQRARPDLQRALGLALLAAGDGRGRPLLEPLLDEHPDDLELREALFGPSENP